MKRNVILAIVVAIVVVTGAVLALLLLQVGDAAAPASTTSEPPPPGATPNRPKARSLDSAGGGAEKAKAATQKATFITPPLGMKDRLKRLTMSALQQITFIGKILVIPVRVLGKK